MGAATGFYPTRHAGRFPKNSINFSRRSCLRSTVFPRSFAPCTWNTFLGRSMPIVVTCMVTPLPVRVVDDISTLAHRCSCWVGASIPLLTFKEPFPKYLRKRVHGNASQHRDEIHDHGRSDVATLGTGGNNITLFFGTTSSVHDSSWTTLATGRSRAIRPVIPFRALRRVAVGVKVSYACSVEMRDLEEAFLSTRRRTSEIRSPVAAADAPVRYTRLYPARSARRPAAAPVKPYARS